MTSCDHIQGAVATAGQVVQWLRDEMKFISSTSEIGECISMIICTSSNMTTLEPIYYLRKICYEIRATVR